MAFPGRARGMWEDRHGAIIGPLGQRISSQDFGTGVRPTGSRTLYQQQSSYYNQHSSSLGTAGFGGDSSVISGKFRLCLDVRQFTAQELEVKTNEKFVVVHGKHDEREDDFGLVAREFTRRYPLPEDVDPETVTSSLTTDGVLVIEAPKIVS